ncbi:hypothetical protein EJB05_25903, partial [Eragrostis curvula]
MNGRFSTTLRLCTSLNRSSFKLVASCPSCHGRDLSLGQLARSKTFKQGSSRILGGGASPFCLVATPYSSPSVPAVVASSSRTKVQSSQLGISQITNHSSLGKATASVDPGIPTPKPINSGPILVTADAPWILRYFKLLSCPIGGRCTQDLQSMRFNEFKADKWEEISSQDQVYQFIGGIYDLFAHKVGFHKGGMKINHLKQFPAMN